jgi:hypothetical protein
MKSQLIERSNKSGFVAKMSQSRATKLLIVVMKQFFDVKTSRARTCENTTLGASKKNKLIREKKCVNICIITTFNDLVAQLCIKSATKA